MKNLKAIILLLLLGFTGSTVVNAQETDAASISKKISSQQYIFIAQVAIPQTGSSQQLTGRYDLTISKDTIISYLPYFGRAYVAPVDETDTGIKFTSTQFEYSNKTIKRGRGWQVTIVPNDVTSVQKMFLTIYKNGTASLDVINTNRQGISFTGYIK